MGGETYQVFGYGFIVTKYNYVYECDIIYDYLDTLMSTGYSPKQISNLDKILTEKYETTTTEPDENVLDDIITKFQTENTIEKFFHVDVDRDGNYLFTVHHISSYSPFNFNELSSKYKLENGELIKKMDNFSKDFQKKSDWLIWFIETE